MRYVRIMIKIFFDRELYYSDVFTQALGELIRQMINRNFRWHLYFAILLLLEKFVWQKFLDKHIDQFNKVDKAILAGYNNTHFDTDFLRQWFIDNNNNYFGSYFWSNSIDVMPEASRYFVHYRPALLNFKLGTVAKAMGIETDKSSLHDGLYDIKLTLLMFKKLLSEPYIKPFDPEEAERMYMQMLEDKKNTPFKKKSEGKFIKWS